jgi:phosphoribosyl-ATP pyrophosphohydrolase/phosphoribosyl-AMP cyclohydrolase
MDGKAVQLVEGKEKVLERDNPEQLASQFDRFGEIAVIDLDAALGRGENRELIKRICRLADCRVGGGIRSVRQALELVSYGAKKVVVGSRVFENNRLNLSFLEELGRAIGKERIIAAADARDREIVIHGWQSRTGLDLFDTAAKLEPYAAELLFTCVEKEGKMKGSDMETIVHLGKVFPGRITAAGGFHSLEEIEELANAGTDVQLGMALYTGKIKLDEAFIRCLNWKQPLLPVIALDGDGQVLMHAYTNKEALQRTFETGNMCYYSRSRQRLWMKGETSGNLQKVIRLRTDCDRDTLIAVVEQTGVACHLGHYSCFGDKTFSLRDLYRVIGDRFDHPVPGSYTATLDRAKVREKILEEANEVIEARDREHIVWEAADLLYFLTVLLQKEDIPIDDILAELYRRRW